MESQLLQFGNQQERTNLWDWRSSETICQKPLEGYDIVRLFGKLNKNRDIFPIASYPIVPRDEVRMRRFNVLDRVQTKARADLAEEEDTLFFGTPAQGASEFAVATDAASVPEANTVQSSTEGVTKEVLAATYAQILQWDLIPDAVIINPREYVDFLTWTRDDVDMERQREILDTGRVGKVWNMQIFMSKLCPAGTLYMRTADEYLGVVPILIDLESIEFPDPKSIAYGFCFYEFLE